VTKAQSKQAYYLQRDTAPDRPRQNLPGINHAATPHTGESRAEQEVTSTMKVSGPGGPTSAAGARGPRPAPAAAGGFQPASAAAAAEPQGAMGASTVNAVSSLEALIALQEVGGPLERRRRAVRRANVILTALEQIKLDLLDGRLGPAAMQALARAVREQRSLTDDPKLEGLLDEIETRAAVELAKFERPGLAT
jgi:hypothetical protein